MFRKSETKSGKLLTIKQALSTIAIELHNQRVLQSAIVKRLDNLVEAIDGLKSSPVDEVSSETRKVLGNLDEAIASLLTPHKEPRVEVEGLKS